jgi:MscS family membrane protein
MLALAIGLGSPTLALPAMPDVHPLEPPDTPSPRATLQSFVGNMQAASDAFTSLMAIYHREPGLFFSPNVQGHHDRLRTLLERAIRCLDVTEVSPALRLKVSLESALLLKEILDRIDLPDPNSVPDAQAIAAAGLERWRIPHTEIVIARVAQGGQAGEFLFSPTMIQRLPEFYAKVRDRPYKPGAWEGAYAFFTTMGVPRYIPWKLTDQLPLWAKAQVWGQAFWRWIVFAVALVAVLGPLTIAFYWIRRRVDIHPIRVRTSSAPACIGGPGRPVPGLRERCHQYHGAGTRCDCHHPRRHVVSRTGVVHPADRGTHRRDHRGLTPVQDSESE